MRLRTADGRTLWLAYGMNVHPGGDAAALLEAVEHVVTPLRARLGIEGPFGLALRLSAAGVDELTRDPALGTRVRDVLARRRLVPFTGNAFVLGAFHDRPLKDEVYRPPWGDPARTDYTVAFARLLAGFHRPGAELSLSTAPGAWAAWTGPGPSADERAAEIAACASQLAALARETGVVVRLGLEPEPGCTLETTRQVRAFFEGPLRRAGRSGEVRRHVGVCFDVCHQAVMHEDVAHALRSLRAQGIAVVKLQASCALEAAAPADPDTRAALGAFDEPVYLHQVGALDARGRRHVAADLPVALDEARWSSRAPWRVHFHVPVFRAAAVPPLATTRPALDVALRLVGTSRVTPHVEIETYTWDVLPERERRAGSGFDLVGALEREITSVLATLRSVGVVPEEAA